MQDEDTTYIQFVMPAELAEAMRRSARDEMVSVSAFLRRAVAKAVSESKPLRSAERVS